MPIFGVKRIIVLLIILMLCPSGLAMASLQLPTGGLISIGGIGSSLTGTTDSMDWNPAALGETPYFLQFSVTPVSAQLSTDDWSVRKIYELVQGELTLSERQELLGQVKDGTLTADFGLRGGAQGAIGSNGAGASLLVHVQGELNYDIIQLFLLGHTPGSSIEHAGSTLETLLIGDYHISSVYSDPWLAQTLHIKGFHMGGSLRLWQGIEYGQASIIGDPISITYEDGIYKKNGGGDIIINRSQKGWGAAVDMGLLLRLTPALAVDVSVLDIGRIWWVDFEENRFTFEVDPQTGKGNYVQVAQKPIEMRVDWSSPAIVRAGLTAGFGKYVQWSLQYSQCLNGASKGEKEWTLGTQLNRFKSLPLRMSAKYVEGSQQLLFSMGMGLELGPLTLDIGTTDLGSLLGAGNETGIAITTGLRF